MKDIVAVVSPIEAHDKYKNENYLKREALLFQRIAIPHLNCCVLSKDDLSDEPDEDDDMEELLKNHFKDAATSPEFIRHFSWLVKNEVIFIEPDKQCNLLTNYDKELETTIHEFLLWGFKVIDDFEPIIKKRLIAANKNPNKYNLVIKNKHKEVITSSNEIFKFRRLYGQLEARILSTILRNYGHEAYPLFSQQLISQIKHQAKKDDVIQIIIESLPTPDSSISWEHIIEYRSDPDTQGKFLALKRWMTKTTKQNLSPNEIEEELEWLLYEHEKHLKVHRMKVNHSHLQTTFTIVPEFLERLIHMEFGEAAKLLFKFRKEKIELLEAEMKLPSQEVAYIIKTKENFK